MANSCPPGAICFGNMTFIIIILIAFAVLYYITTLNTTPTVINVKERVDDVIYPNNVVFYNRPFTFPRFVRRPWVHRRPWIRRRHLRRPFRKLRRFRRIRP